MITDYVLKINRGGDLRIARYHNVVLIATIGFTFLSIYISILNSLFYHVNFLDLYIAVIPLIAYVYYDVFYSVNMRYNRLEVVVMILSIFLFFIMLVISHFLNNKIITFTSTLSVLIIFTYVMRIILIHIYLRLSVYSINNSVKKVSKLSIKICQNKNESVKSEQKYKEKLTKLMVSLEVWMKLTPGNIKLNEMKTILKSYLSIHEMMQKVILVTNLSKDDFYLEYRKKIEMFEKMFLFRCVEKKSITLIEKVLAYYIEKAELYFEFSVDEAQILIRKYLNSTLEVLIQNARVIEFDQGISMLMQFLQQNCDDKCVSDQKKEFIRITLFNSITLINKYLDNVNTIAGKFILQFIAKNYIILREDEEDDELEFFLFTLIEFLKGKDSNINTVSIYYHFLSSIAEKFEGLKELAKFYKRVIRALSSLES